MDSTTPRRLRGYCIHVQRGLSQPIQKLPTIWASDTPEEWATIIANKRVSYARLVRSGRTLHTYQRAEVQA